MSVQSNGLVEKVNGIIIDRMAAFIGEEYGGWDTLLSQAVFSINTSVQDSNKFSPFQLVYGITPVLPVEARFPWPPSESSQNRLANLATNRQLVKHRILKAHQAHKKFYDRRRSPALVFAPGDLVLVRRKRTRKGIPKKLQPRYLGPYEVRRQLSATTYEVGDLPCHQSRRRFHLFAAHSEQLKRWICPRSLGDDDESEEEKDWEASNEEQEDPETTENRGLDGIEEDGGAAENQNDTIDLPLISPEPCDPDQSAERRSASRLDGTLELLQQTHSGSEEEHHRPSRTRRLPRYLQEHYMLD